MPELPEVDKMARSLDDIFIERSLIFDVQVLRETKKYLPGNEREDLKGAHVLRVYRRGKFLVFMTSQGLLVCHNAMSGFWDLESEPWTFDYVEGKRQATERDVRIKLHVGLGLGPLGKTLRFHDTRLFGSLRFYKDVLRFEEVPSLRSIGPDAIMTPMTHLPFDKYRIGGMEVNRSVYLGNMFRDRHKPVKEVLMDQSVIAGLGNIYSAEALWLAYVDPSRLASALSPKQVSDLSDAIEDVLRSAIARNLKYDGHLRVYRQGTCPRDGSYIQKVKLAGRSTYFCPTCQV